MMRVLMGKAIERRLQTREGRIAMAKEVHERIKANRMKNVTKT